MKGVWECTREKISEVELSKLGDRVVLQTPSFMAELGEHRGQLLTGNASCGPHGDRKFQTLKGSGFELCIMRIILFLCECSRHSDFAQSVLFDKNLEGYDMRGLTAPMFRPITPLASRSTVVNLMTGRASLELAVAFLALVTIFSGAVSKN